MEETRIDYKRLLFFAFLGSLTILLLLRLAGASEAMVIDLAVVDQDGGEMATVVLDIPSQTANPGVETEYEEETARQLVTDGRRGGGHPLGLQRRHHDRSF